VECVRKKKSNAERWVPICPGIPALFGLDKVFESIPTS